MVDLETWEVRQLIGEHARAIRFNDGPQYEHAKRLIELAEQILKMIELKDAA